MRRTKVLYIENDSALRKILGTLLSQSDELEIIGSFSTGDEIKDPKLIKNADVALIDFLLDENGLNGVELGISLRRVNEYLGVVVYSQYSVTRMVNRVPLEIRHGWSFFDKSAEMELENYVDIIKRTSMSKGNWEEILTSSNEGRAAEKRILFDLTSQQRLIMSLTTQSKSSRQIAEQMNLSYSYIRKELSRSYAILLPDAEPGSDLKTAAILKYLQLMRES